MKVADPHAVSSYNSQWLAYGKTADGSQLAVGDSFWTPTRPASTRS
jgi:hypothetical protein